MRQVLLIDGQITPNFSIFEVACKDNGEILLNAAVIDHAQRLQKFRNWYKRKMPSNSWYRTASYNKKVGGVSNSQHLLGIATDIALPNEFLKASKSRQNEWLNNMKHKWKELCDQDELAGGVVFYNTFIHLDSRSLNKSGNKSLAFEDKRK